MQLIFKGERDLMQPRQAETPPHRSECVAQSYSKFLAIAPKADMSGLFLLRCTVL